MDPNDSTAPVETAPASTESATAPAATASAESSTAETTSTSQPQRETVADVNAQLRAFYDGAPTTDGADAGRTEESAQAPTGKEGQDGKEPSTDDGKTPEAKTPADDPKTPDAPEQMRPRLHDPEDIAIAALAKARGIKLSEAAAILAPKATASIPGAESGQQPSPVQAQEAKVADLQKKLDEAEAGDDYLTPDYHRLSRQFLQESNRLDALRSQEQQAGAVRQNAEAETQHLRDRQESVDTVTRDFPDAISTATALGKAYHEVVTDWTAEAKASPQRAEAMTAPRAPEEILREAALRLARDPTKYPADPATGKAPAPLSSQAPVPQLPVRRVTPASGSRAREGNAQPSTLTEAMLSANNAKDSTALLKEFYDRKKLQ